MVLIIFHRQQISISKLFIVILLIEYQVCGVCLTDNVVEIIFHVFDSNRDGNLSLAEFVRVLHQRGRDIAQHVDTGIMVLD